MAIFFTSIKKISIQFAGFVAICLVRFLGCCKRTQIFAFPVKFNERSPFAIGLDKGNPLVPGGIGDRFFSVKTICLLCAFSQIGRPIIRAITVNVIYVLLRPFPRNKKPSKSVGVVKTVINANSHIPVRVYAASFTSFRAFSSSGGFPCELSRIWVVIQKFKNAGSGSFIFHRCYMSSVMTLFNRRLLSQT